jgi:hypothetical protein
MTTIARRTMMVKMVVMRIRVMIMTRRERMPMSMMKRVITTIMMMTIAMMATAMKGRIRTMAIVNQRLRHIVNNILKSTQHTIFSNTPSTSPLILANPPFFFLHCKRPSTLRRSLPKPWWWPVTL